MKLTVMQSVPATVLIEQQTPQLVLREKSTETIEVLLARGLPGKGMPTGGAPGQVQAKKSTTDFDTEWVDLDITSDPLAYYILAKT